MAVWIGPVNLGLKNGSRLLNEVRDRIGLDPLLGGDTPMVLTATGYVPIVPQVPAPLGKADWNPDLHPRWPAGAEDGRR